MKRRHQRKPRPTIGRLHRASECDCSSTSSSSSTKSNSCIPRPQHRARRTPPGREFIELKDRRLRGTFAGFLFRRVAGWRRVRPTIHRRPLCATHSGRGRSRVLRQPPAGTIQGHRGHQRLRARCAVLACAAEDRRRTTWSAPVAASAASGSWRTCWPRTRPPGGNDRACAARRSAIQMAPWKSSSGGKTPSGSAWRSARRTWSARIELK